MIFFCFFLSGFAALLYQIIWTRLAFTHFGVIAPILSMTLAIFMLGLGAGSWLGGYWVRRYPAVSPVRWLWIYAGIEAAIALWAFFIPLIFYWSELQLYTRPGMASHVYLGMAGVYLVLALLPPCFGMGLTVPIMMAASRFLYPTPTRFSFLYNANLWGALSGVLAAPFIGIELFGLRQTLYGGIAAQALAALTAISVILIRRKPSPALGSAAAPTTLPPAASPWVLWILALSGFITLASEVLWVRALTPTLGTSIYAFAQILAVYMVFTLLGSMLYRRRKIGGLPLDVAYGVFVLSAWLPALLMQGNGPQSALSLLFSIAPLCAITGFMTPQLVDMYAGGDAARAGRAYAMNTIGCVLGPLVAGYGLLPHWGSHASMVGLAAAVSVFVLALWPRRAAVLFVLVNALVMLLSVHSPGLDESPRDASMPREIRRDTVATVVSAGSGMQKRLYVNGVGITELTPLTKIMAHLPLVLLEQPKKALMICFGMGTTYRSLLSWDIDTAAVELVPSVRDAFGFYHADAAQVMANPKGRIVIDDGRRFLARSGEKYDVITLDPPPPVEAAGSGLLYSSEFYDLIKARLAPGGILQQWWPSGERRILYAVTRSLQKSFPYLVVYKGVSGAGFHFLASERPIPSLTPEKAIKRMPKAAREDLLEWTNGSLTLTQAWTNIFRQRLPLDHLLITDSAVEITDDRPYNEYYVLRRRLADHRGDNFWIR